MLWFLVVLVAIRVTVRAERTTRKDKGVVGAVALATFVFSAAMGLLALAQYIGEGRIVWIF